MNGRESNNFMKMTKWMGLLAAIALPLFSARAQGPVSPVPPDGQFDNQAISGPAGVPAPGAPSAPASVPTDLTVGTAEVIRLAEAGSGDDVVLAYIRNSQLPFSLSADHILYLKDLGIS